MVVGARKLMQIRRFSLPPHLATAGKFATFWGVFTFISLTTRSFRPCTGQIRPVHLAVMATAGRVPVSCFSSFDLVRRRGRDA